MMDNETKLEAIDGETVDLFAFMNSSIVELQIEMEMLENKEYQKEDNSNEIGNGYTRSKPPATPKPLEKQNNPIKDLETTITTAKPTTVDWQAMEPAKLGDQDYSPVSDYSPGKAVVVAGVQERQDNSSSNVPQPFATVTPAKVGDADYAPVSDYTNRATAETIANAMAKVAAAASKASVKRV